MSFTTVEDDGIYEVEAIRASRACKHNLKPKTHDYLIKWKGYDSDENTWECSQTIDAPELLEKFWSKQHMGRQSVERKNGGGSKKQPRKRQTTSTDDVKLGQSTQKKTKRTKQSPVVIANPCSSDEDENTVDVDRNLDDDLERFTATTLTSLSPQPNIAFEMKPNVLKPTSSSPLTYATTVTHNASPLTTSATLLDHQDLGSRAHHTISTVIDDSDGTVSETSNDSEQQEINDSVEVSFHEDDKDGNPLIIYNKSVLQVCSNFREHWDWEQQVSHIKKLIIKKRQGTPTFYFVIRWNDGILSAHDSNTIRSKCPLKALDFHEKRLVDQY
ncbi:hypothetical protein BC941DRAFT_475219 [Chlamydoabsidia padenii]|nr:hypothetical protein BC941DRAFT_475219 [Chlamydoabsidia padenii]